MKLIWNLLILIAGAYNAYDVARLWHDGGQPDSFVYLSSIFFSIGVAMTGFEGLVTSKHNTSTQGE